MMYTWSDIRPYLTDRLYIAYQNDKSVMIQTQRELTRKDFVESDGIAGGVYRVMMPSAMRAHTLFSHKKTLSNPVTSQNPLKASN